VRFQLTKRAKEKEKEFGDRESDIYVLGESALAGANMFELFAFLAEIFCGGEVCYFALIDVPKSTASTRETI
jgi:hypothetical protein